MAAKKKGPRAPNLAQQATLHDLATGREGYEAHRIAWEGKTMLLGVYIAGSYRMYRVAEDGKATGV